MHLFLTSVLPFLAHDHASAVAFLTCRHHNFHSSIIPEFLSDEERVRSFCEARQQYEFDTVEETQYTKLYNLFVQTPLMQFSPSLVLQLGYSVEPIIESLLETKYFTRTLQRCTVLSKRSQPLSTDVLHGLSKVQSLTKLDLDVWEVNNNHLEIIINSFHSLETLTILFAGCLQAVDSNTAINIASSPPPAATKTLRSLRLNEVDALFATQFVCNFPNLRKLELFGLDSFQDLDLLSSSLPLLTNLSFDRFDLNNIESLDNLVHLSTLQFRWCYRSDLSFLTHKNTLPHLTTLVILGSRDSSTSSFASLAHAPNLQVLRFNSSDFNNDCLQYLENMVHLRELDLSHTNVIGDSRSLKILMQNLFQLEELQLWACPIGNQGAVAGALYSSHSRLRVLNLSSCRLVDDDLNGIAALKNSLEVLDLNYNRELTNEALVHCKDLVKLKVLNLRGCSRIKDLSPLKDCLNLEEFDVGRCTELTDDSFKVFSNEPTSFPNLRRLNLQECDKLKGEIFKHFSKNKHLVYQLKELRLWGRRGTTLSASDKEYFDQLKGLQRFRELVSGMYRPWVKLEGEKTKFEEEIMMRRMREISK